MLLTDYAPVMFDYAGLDRPIVVHTEDWAAYEAARGAYFDLRDFPPGAVARSEDELIDIFATGHWCGSRSAQLRAAFRGAVLPVGRRAAAERVVAPGGAGRDGAAAGGTARGPAPRPCRPARAPQLVTVPQPSGPRPVTDGR